MCNKFAPFVQWLWDNRNVDRAFHPGVLTSTNLVDVTLPRPPLTDLEAIDLFVYLKGLNLLFPKGEHGGAEVYTINKIEDYKWKTAIKELNTPEWKRNALYTELKKYLTIIIAGFLGGVGGFSLKQITNWISPEPITKQNATSNSNSQTGEIQN